MAVVLKKSIIFAYLYLKFKSNLTTFFRMKKNLLLSKLLRGLLASILIAGAAATASAAGSTIDIGYASTQEQIYAYDGLATDNDASVYVAAILTPDLMQTYAGGRIVGLRMGWSCSYQSGKVDMFIREGNLDAENKVQKTGTAKFGWNTFTFDTPYEISENPENIIIGYHVNTKAQTYCIPHSWLNTRPANSFYITQDEFKQADGTYEWEDVSSIYGALMVVAIVEVDNDITNRAEITSIVAPEIYKEGVTGTGLMTVANRGSNDITKIRLQYTCGDKEKKHTVSLSSAIKPNASSKVSVPVAVLGSGETTVSIVQVNGKDNGIETSATLPILTVPGSVAGKYTRRPLLEYFGSEGSHYNVLYYDAYFMGVYEDYKDQMSVVCHHLNDQFMTRDDEDTRMLVDMADGDLTQVQMPSMTLDRSFQSANSLVSSAQTVAFSILTPTPYAVAVYDEALAVPTFANIKVNNSYDADKAELTINVDGFIEPGVLPQGEKLKLTVYLLEDNVASTAQDWADANQQEAYGGVYHHQNLIRQQPVPIWGDELDGDGSYSRTYVTEIDPEEWKQEDMHVVALLHRSENNARFSRQVINCAEAAFGLSSIHEITLEGASDAKVAVTDGTITINGSTDGVRVYTISGTQVANRSLPAGLYVVGKGQFTSKVLVK